MQSPACITAAAVAPTSRGSAILCPRRVKGMPTSYGTLCLPLLIGGGGVRSIAMIAALSSPFEGGAQASPPPSSGLYSAAVYELTTENVDRVLDDVRPYLIADGGNVDVVGVEEGIVSLKLQGACGSCPSSTTTMKMGIEKVLKEKFGEALKEIRQVIDDPPAVTTAEVVNQHLEILRPAVENYGGSVQVLSVDGENCYVRYTGMESIGSGIKAAIKEKFPSIANVIFE